MQIFLALQLGGEGGAPSSNEIHRNVKTILRVSAIAVIPFTITFPSVRYYHDKILCGI